MILIIVLSVIAVIIIYCLKVKRVSKLMTAKIEFKFIDGKITKLEKQRLQRDFTFVKTFLNPKIVFKN